MSRPLAVALLLLIALALLALMWVGWRRRVSRTAVGLGPATASLEQDATLAVEGVYVSSTTAGEWLDRIAADGLGVRSRVVVEVGPTGVAMLRTGAPDVLVPAVDLRGARRERGIAGKVVGGGRDHRGGLVVLRWRRGDVELDTGVKPRYRTDADALVAAVNAITPSPQSTQSTQPAQPQQPTPPNEESA